MTPSGRAFAAGLRELGNSQEVAFRVAEPGAALPLEVIDAVMLGSAGHVQDLELDAPPAQVGHLRVDVVTHERQMRVRARSAPLRDEHPDGGAARAFQQENAFSLLEHLQAEAGEGEGTN